MAPEAKFRCYETDVKTNTASIAESLSEAISDNSDIITMSMGITDKAEYDEHLVRWCHACGPFNP